MKKWKIKGTIKELFSAPKINLPLKIYQKNWDEESQYCLIQGILYNYAYGYIYVNEEKTYFEEPIESKTVWYTNDIPLTAISNYFWTNIQDNSTITIANLYNIDSKKYMQMEIERMGFSHRLTKFLLQNKIETASQLMQISFEDLEKIRNLGKKSIEEVKSFCENLQSESNSLCDNITFAPMKLTIKNSIIFELAPQISQGDFSFFENIILNDKEKKIVEKYRSSMSIIGEDFAKKCLFEAITVKKIILGLSEYILDTTRYRKAKELAIFIPQDMLKKEVRGYIKAYTSNIKIQNELMGLWSDSNAIVGSILESTELITEEKFVLLKSFFEWCAFDITKEANLICKKLYDDQRILNIIDLRASGKTLEEVGAHLNLSRERIRQIEKDAKRIFNNLDIRHKFSLKIKAAEEVQEINESVLLKYTGCYTKGLLYLMKKNH